VAREVEEEESSIWKRVGKQAVPRPPSLVSKYSTPSFYSSIKEKQKGERKKERS
jgi:hypothetical protein